MKFLSQINVNTEYTLPIVDGANGQVLATDGNGTAYWGSISVGATNLNALTDVVISSPSTGQLLRYGIPVGSEDPNPVWYNWSPNYLTFSSSIDALGDVTISTATAGQILQYNGTAWVNTTLSTVEYVSKVQHLVKAGVAITKGQAVYITGADGTNMIVGLASNASEATSSKVIGLAVSNAAINDQIFVVTEGLIAGLNTSTANAGDAVWLGTSGNLIFGLLNKPVAPAHLVYIGVVTRVQSNNGEIFVNVQNGFELNELHDVLINGVSTGQLIRRDSDGLWKNWTPNFLTSLPAHTHDDRYYTESEIDAFFGGDTAIAGYNLIDWDAAYADKINSASFSTTTGVLTLTQQDTGTITVDLDGRYLQSFTETDPTVPTHVKSITATNISNWNDAVNDSIRSAAFNTADGVLTLTQVDLGTVTVDLDGRYLQTFTETDPTVPVYVKAITETQIGDWDRAYNWGNHADYGYAPVASPSFTGTPLAPTAPAGTNTTQIATTAFVRTAITNLVDSAPATLDTLNELAAALGDDPNFATTVTNSIATKMPYYHNAISGDPGTAINGVTRIYPTANGPIGAGHFTVFTALQDSVNYGWQFTSVGNDAYFRSKDTTWGGWHTIATQSWVQTQGYLTSIPDEYLTQTEADALYQPIGSYLTAEADTLATVVARGSTTSSPISVVETTGGGFLFRTSSSWGGWARNGFSFANGSGTVMKSLGAYGGSGTSLSYMYLGTDYLTNTFRIYDNYVYIPGLDLAMSNNNNSHGAGTYFRGDGSHFVLGLNNGNTLYLNYGNGAGVLRTYGTWYHHDVQILSTSRVLTNVSGNISMFTNDSGYITGYTETDTLATVTGRGSSTTTALTINADDGIKVIYNGTGGDTWLRGWGIESNRGAVYLRPTTNDSQNLYIGYSDGNLSWNTVSIDASALDWNGNTLATRTWVQSQGYLTSETDSQTLSWDFGAKNLSISNGNTVTLDGLATEEYVTSQGYITGYTETDTLASVTGRGRLTSSSGSAVWDETIQGTGLGNIQLDTVATDNAGGAITWKSSDGGTGAQAGIYVRSDGNYGTKMYIATSDNYSVGSKTAISIDHYGFVNVTRGNDRLRVNGNTVWHAGNDGSSSGLDADLLDGNHASAFATRQDGARYTTNFNSILSSGFFNGDGQPSNAPDDYGQLIVAKGIDTGLQIFGGYDSNNLWFRGWGYGPEADGFYPWRKIWHDGNDGAGTGLDADLLDGQHGSYYQPASTAITTSNIGSQSVATSTQTYRVIVEDTRSGQRTPNDYDDYRASWEFTNQIPGLSGSTWWSLMTVQGWHNAYSAWQIIGPSDAGPENWYLRVGNNTTWGTARRIWHAGDFSSTNVSNWNTAYGWGNHAGLYLPIGGGNATGWVSFSSSTQGTPIIKAVQQDSSSGYYLFQGVTGSSEVFRVERTGNIVTSGTLSASGYNKSNWDAAYGWGNHADYAYWNTDSVDAKNVQSAEVIFAGNVTVEGTFTESSSIRFKENIAPLDPALDKVNQLEAVSYNKIGVDDREIGLIAEDVAELFPEVVTYNEEGQPQGIQYQRLSVILLKAVQELTERVNKLENK